MGKIIKLDKIYNIATPQEVYINTDRIQTIEIIPFKDSLVEDDDIRIKITMGTGEVWVLGSSEKEYENVLKKLGHIEYL